MEYNLYRFTTSCFLLWSLLLTLKTFPLTLHSRKCVPGRRVIPKYALWIGIQPRLMGNELDPPHAGQDSNLNTRLADKMILLLHFLKKERELVVCTQRDDLSDRALVCESHICFSSLGPKKEQMSKPARNTSLFSTSY